jgi:ABC-type transporter Mla subunit MlaD
MIRRVIIVPIVAIVLVAITGLMVNRPGYYRQNVKSCFDDVSGLHAGATVRIAGVDVGTVHSVRANPQRKSCPAEVDMTIATTYEIKIPKGSFTEINTSGVLGATYVSITANASGPPVENYGYLTSKPIKPVPSAADYLKALDVVLKSVQASKGAQPDSEGQSAAPLKSNPR